uniref:Uncharacterized protein n=1 Tax=Rhizophora mucronata TaxID=61149 RepID=A0A2P2K1L2_RHIMU
MYILVIQYTACTSSGDRNVRLKQHCYVRNIELESGMYLGLHRGNTAILLYLLPTIGPSFHGTFMK